MIALAFFRIENHDGHGNILITDNCHVANQSAGAGKKVYTGIFIQDGDGPLVQILDWQLIITWTSLSITV